MSIDLNWETLTTGPDGDALALRIRDFIHDKFQTIKLPRFLKSVTVHAFEFGAVPPELELKDITDPLPDFYEAEAEDDEDDDDDVVEGGPGAAMGSTEDLGPLSQERRRRDEAAQRAIPPTRLNMAGRSMPDLTSPFFGVGTPGIMGGANRHYFQSQLASGWSGTQTPLAAVAGGHLGNPGWLENLPSASTSRDEDVTPSHSRNASQSSVSEPDFGSSLAPPVGKLREKSSVSTLAPTSAGPSRPPTRDAVVSGSAIEEEDDEEEAEPQESPPLAETRTLREPRVEDMQAVFRIKYAGDVKLRLTAVILLDYPMPNFVGIPVKLNITGLTFDGVGVLAYIRKKVHFCFLSPEDAVTAVGLEAGEEEGEGRKGKFGGLLQEVKVESEIGEREAGKQSLKNVGKVERFVLEQVRRIFEDEFVYPSFWTFLV
ncbi:hypothetical protein jhhlp_000990 [Lomentospora prolificans]|uniref:Mitochondrial distribution and morphology protein 12 n=1 Tax=Lomentospora prolificans TaxID=41688 RepID=A0A2N3NK07_9PEZI|nr:hypothetical protein jhhlp_000990 [Lomentospora prolificans]